MATNIKRLILDAFASHVATADGLTDRVSPLQDGPDQQAVFPSVMLVPSSFTFEAWTATEVAYNEDEDDGKLLMDVGEFTGNIELRLYAKNVPEREDYEQRILNLFLANPDAPGTITITTPPIVIGEHATLYQASIIVRLTSELWREEFAFESRRYTFVDLEFAYPALVLLDNVPTINQLELHFEYDPGSETVIVQDDGTIIRS
jgi:hypothetical protein